LKRIKNLKHQERERQRERERERARDVGLEVVRGIFKAGEFRKVSGYEEGHAVA
jgi:hypothetical protein